MASDRSISLPSCHASHHNCPRPGTHDVITAVKCSARNLALDDPLDNLSHTAIGIAFIFWPLTLVVVTAVDSMTVVVPAGACIIPQSLDDDTLLERTLAVPTHRLAVIAAVTAFHFCADRPARQTIWQLAVLLQCHHLIQRTQGVPW